MRKLLAKCESLTEVPQDLAVDFIKYGGGAASTLRGRELALRQLDEFLSSDDAGFEAFDEAALERFMGHLLSKMGPRSANASLSHVKSFLRFLRSEGCTVACREREVWSQKVDNGESYAASVLELREIRRILLDVGRYERDVKGLRDALAVNLMLRYGVKSVQLVRLRSDDAQPPAPGLSASLRLGGNRLSIASDVWDLVEGCIAFGLSDGARNGGIHLIRSLAKRNAGSPVTEHSVSKIVKQRLSSCGIRPSHCRPSALTASSSRLAMCRGLDLEGTVAVLDRLISANDRLEAKGYSGHAKASALLNHVLDGDDDGLQWSS